MFEEFRKQQRGGLSPRTRPAGPLGFMHVADPRLRIALLLLLLLLLAGMVALLRGWAATPEASSQTAEVPAMTLGSSRGEFDFGSLPTFDPAIAERITDTGEAARRRWEDEAVPYLLHQTNIPAVAGYNSMLLPIVKGSYEEIREDSRPWRFKYVRFRGDLEYMVEQDYEEVYGGDSDLGRVRRGRTMLLDDGTPVRVTFVTRAVPMWSDPNDIDSPLQLIEDGWVRGRGILVKNYLDDFGGEEVPSVLVVATDLRRDYETVPVDSLDDIPFQIIQDDPSFIGEEGYRDILAKLYPRAMFRLMRWAERYAGPDKADARAQAGLEPRRFDDQQTYEEMLTTPMAFRAKYFGGLGVLALTPEVDGPETTPANDAGIDEYMHGWILTDRQRVLWFTAPVSLATRDWRKGDRIVWEGYFYKWRAYGARDGQDHLAPMFVLTRLDTVPPPERDLAFDFYLAGGAIAGLALLIFIIVREDRVKQDYRRRHGRGRVSDSLGGGGSGTPDDA